MPIHSAAQTPSERATRLASAAEHAVATGELDEAARLYHDAAALFEAAGRLGAAAGVYHDLGVMYGQDARPRLAIESYHRALRLSDVASLPPDARTLHNLGRAHLDIGQVDSAFVYLYRARFHARGGPDGEAVALNGLASAHQSAGRADSALVYYRASLALRRVHGPVERVAAALNNLADLYLTLNRPDSALVLGRQGLALWDDFDPIYRVAILNTVARAHQQLGRPDSALVYLREAQRAHTSSRDRRGGAALLNGIGASFLGLGEPESAVQAFEGALDLARKTGDAAMEGIILHNLGYAALARGRLDAATDWYRQAVDAHRRVANRNGEAASLSDLGFIALRRTPPDLRSAVAYFDAAAVLLETLAGTSGGDQNRLSLLESQAALYSMWALAWLHLQEDVGPMVATLASLAAMERGRARALLSLLHDTPQEPRLPGSDLAAEGADLLIRLSEPARQGGILSYALVPDGVFGWYIDQAGHTSMFVSPIEADSLVALAASALSALGASADADRAPPALEAPYALRGIEAVGSDDIGLEEVLKALADILLPQFLLDHILAEGELVLVPQGVLGRLPWAALPLPTGEPLAARYALRYAPSLAVLADVEARPGRPLREIARGALVVGNPTMPTVRDDRGAPLALPPLAGAEAEGTWVAALLGVEPLSGADASEAVVRQRLPEAGLVHLATHGFAFSHAEMARRGFVALAPGDGHDGLLTVGEVLDEVAPLAAELVVLSACQTGLGDLREAEGTVGLQRAFLARGARSVLVSLWNVSDAATDLLMRRFYEYWEATGSKAEALRRAQLNVRAEPGSRFHHARYWAAFQLVGAD